MSRVIKGAVISGEGPKIIKSVMYDSHIAAAEQESAAPQESPEEAAQRAALALMIEEHRRRAEKLVADAEQQSCQIMAEAQNEAARIVEAVRQQAAAEAEELKKSIYDEFSQKGYEEGHAHGYKAGREEMAELVDKANEKAQHTIKLAEQEAEKALLGAEKQMVELTMAIAGKVIAGMVAEAPQLILTQVQAALSKVKDQHEIKIKVNPDDYDFVLMAKDEFRSQLSSDCRLEIAVDNKVEAGGCIIESNNGNVDARLSTKMEAVMKAVQEAAG